MKFALCQLSSSSDSVSHNIALIMDAAQRCKDKECDVLVFPEAMQMAFGGDLNRAAGQWDRFVDGLVKAAGITHSLVIAGGFRPSKGDDMRVRNTVCFVNEHELVHSYDKIHGFNALGYREIDAVQPGADVPQPYQGIGCAICFDLRFPAMFCKQARMGASVIVVSASWGDGALKAEQWHTLTRARALDSCSFIVAVDQADPRAVGKRGFDNEPCGIGLSAVWAPDGKCLAKLGRGNDIHIVDVPVSHIAQYRSDLSILDNQITGIDK